mgnify:CR=1 FL=1
MLRAAAAAAAPYPEAVAAAADTAADDLCCLLRSLPYEQRVFSLGIGGTTSGDEVVGRKMVDALLRSFGGGGG